MSFSVGWPINPELGLSFALGQIDRSADAS
jgi:hypothetical protein